MPAPVRLMPAEKAQGDCEKSDLRHSRGGESSTHAGGAGVGCALLTLLLQLQRCRREVPDTCAPLRPASHR